MLLLASADPNFELRKIHRSNLCCSIWLQKGTPVLLNARADIDIQTTIRSIALHKAASRGCYAIVELLLTSGANA